MNFVSDILMRGMRFIWTGQRCGRCEQWNMRVSERGMPWSNLIKQPGRNLLRRSVTACNICNKAAPVAELADAPGVTSPVRSHPVQVRILSGAAAAENHIVRGFG